MEQKVKIQLSADLEDVTKLSSLTLDDALENLQILQSLVNQIKKELRNVDILDEAQRDRLKQILLELDNSRLFLIKVDMRLGDVASVVNGLDSHFKNPKDLQKAETDDSVSTG